MIAYANQAARQHLDLSDGDIGKPVDELAELYPVKFWRERLARTDVMVRRNGVELQCMGTTHQAEEGIVLVLDWERVQVEDEFRFFIMDNMSEAVVLLDANGAVLYLNSAAKVMLRVGLHGGQARYWTVGNLGEFAPADFWRYPAYKKEVLFRKEDDEAHLLASAYHQSDKVILVLEEEKRETLRFIRQESLAATDLDALAGVGPELRRQAMVLANSDLSFLITGESGTGKEVMARAVHYSSVRAKGPFVVIDCTALPEHLVESELFGYEPGSFTSASRDGRAGKFELADGGTIMLDEISELPLAMQPKLLRILNDQMVMRIGARKPKPVNVRVIACTNRDLRAMVEKGQFREDLFYRLKGATLNLPPLRERMKHFDALLELFLKKYGHGTERRFAPQALAVLHNFRWPGNVRELEKAVQYALAQDPAGEIGPELLPGDIIHGTLELREGRLKEMVRLHERALVASALQASAFNVTATAARLGLTRMGLSKKIAALGIRLPGKRSQRFPKRMGRGNRARIEILEVAPTAVAPRGSVRIAARITNTGRNPWLNVCKTRVERRGKYIFQCIWSRAEDLTRYVAYSNIPLPGPVHPDESVSVSDDIKAPNAAGEYVVYCCMALAGVAGFADNPVGNNEYNAKNFPHFRIMVA
ncbi:PAS domain-containing protein [bacterium]|nr:PAS domain-containing protein [bacterium]